MLFNNQRKRRSSKMKYFLTMCIINMDHYCFEPHFIQNLELYLSLIPHSIQNFSS